jgi:hypothetical protein
MDAFGETLRSWQNFYFMAGGAAATLIGLMFVALSLGMHLINDKTRQEMHTFVTPSVVYFVSALLLSCVMLVPAAEPVVLALALLLGSLLGFARTIPHVRLLIEAARRHQDFVPSDWLWQIITPLVCYALILGAALGFVANQPALAFFGAWLADILLLMCAISNTWSLVIWIVEQRRD